jgi:exodeoxyribonuclease-5
MKQVRDLTDEQKNALDAAIQLIEGYGCKTCLKIGGFAGTGKTTLAAAIRDVLKDVWKNKIHSVAFVTFTGKASVVLKVKLGNSLTSLDYCGTIHSLIYKPIVSFLGGKKRIIGWRLKTEDELSFDAIIIDEASMISGYIWQDLVSYNIPMVVIGDHGQLPPVDGKFNLMDNPDLFLTQIHRQALSSPIIQLSKIIRETGFVPNITTPSVFRLDWSSDQCQKIWNKLIFDESLMILCGFNYTRVWLNQHIRNKIGFHKEEPYPGERLICLKNNRDGNVMNGQIGTLTWLIPYRHNMNRMVVQFDDRVMPFEGIVHDSCFGKESYEDMFNNTIITKEMIAEVKNDGYSDGIHFFDFGYAISVHKSQGSEWRRVILFEQRSQYWDDDYYKRWLYTGVTRASEKLFIISNFD